MCCIENSRGLVDIGFTSSLAAERWETLTGSAVTWIDDEEVETVAEAYFPRDQITAICDRLRLP